MINNIILLTILLTLILLYFNIQKTKMEGFVTTWDNPNQNIYKKTTSVYKLEPEQKTYSSINDCLKYCSEKDCLKFIKNKSALEKCIKCEQEEKCMNNLYTSPVCDNCMIGKKNKSCYENKDYLCPNPNNMYSINKVAPYFIINNIYDNINNYDNNQCTFCWNL